ncbi:peptide chain release factor N(5)-glutamine methyltransferase [Candidatus Saccharibacteria bacterium]|nr:MAG: peptide chain release factor N(5)-glutamine methyltransferase [Candidatus Saccharibacteria bacterium]
MAVSIDRFLREATNQLHMCGIETARLDSLVLLSDELGHDKAWVLAHSEYCIQGSVLKKLNIKIAQRSKHIPLAYIRGKSEFYGREFMVNKHVLVPRPESESMIDLLKRFVGPDSRTTIIDVGTGSGCLAITARLELANSTVVALDSSHECLRVAKQNATKLVADITFLESDLLNSMQDSSFKIQDSILLANLPYVPNDYPINNAATHEPTLALFGGSDGLELFRRLFSEVKGLGARCIVTESLTEQHAQLAQIARNNSFRLTASDGLAQLFLAD